MNGNVESVRLCLITVCVCVCVCERERDSVREKTFNKWNCSIQIDKWIRIIDGCYPILDFRFKRTGLTRGTTKTTQVQLEHNWFTLPFLAARGGV